MMNAEFLKSKIFLMAILLIVGSIFSCKKNSSPAMDYLVSDVLKLNNKNIKIFPVNHASFGLQIEDTMILVDPVGGKKLYENMRKADLLLITHIHHDHFNIETINNVKKDNTVLLGPIEVKEKLHNVQLIKNGGLYKFKDLTIKAIPMYNLHKDRMKYHQKGKGNGYIVTDGKFNIYISGDTEDIPEMRALENIDAAFICMNLPYTMTVEQAASAVLDFKPGIVYPYHYRGQGGFSDIKKFKELVGKDKKIEVRFLKWY